MSTQTYEIEHVAANDHNERMLCNISMLTGLPLDELKERLDASYYRSSGYWGRDLIAAFRQLGYNCNPRFVPFDPATPYPCLMRFSPTKRQMVREGIKRPWWCVLVYYDGKVYDSGCCEPYAFKPWDHTHFKVTSMLQVWISDL